MVDPNKPQRLELIVSLEKKKRRKKSYKFLNGALLSRSSCFRIFNRFYWFGIFRSSIFLFRISTINLFASIVLKNFFNFIVTITYFGSLDFDKLWEEIFSCLSSCPNEFLVLFFLGFIVYWVYVYCNFAEIF